MSSTKKKPTGSPRTEPGAVRKLVIARFDDVLELIKGGMAAYKAAAEVGVPLGSFYLYLDAEPAAAEKYARAMAARHDVMAEQLLEIQDEEPPLREPGGESPGDAKADAAWVTWQKNRVDTRKWLLSKMAPKKYGDASRVELDAGGNLISILAKLTD